MDKPFQAYQGDEPYVFVCYAHDDEDVVYPEIAWLHEQGINIWYDEGISAGKVWRRELAKAIQGASKLLYYISNASLQSEHCNREIEYALDKEVEVVPVYLDETELTPELDLALNRVQALHRDQGANYSQHLLNALRQATIVEPPLVELQREKKSRRPRASRIQYAVRTDGARVAYAVMGAGPVLIIPPGGTTHVEWFTSDTVAHEKFCARLAEHRTLVMYDRHGFGLSDRNRTDFTAEDDLKDLEAVIETVGAPTFDFFGISWGGGPTLAYAARHPERTRKIVLYGTGSAGRAGPSKEVVATGDSLAALRRADSELYCKTRALQYFPSGTDAETFASFTRMLLHSTTLEMAENLEGVHLETQSLLSDINVPALVVHRRGDQCAMFEWGQYIARRLPNAYFIPLDGDAHFPWVGDADSVLTPTIEFLTSD